MQPLVVDFTGFVTQQSLVRDAEPEQSDAGEMLKMCVAGISMMRARTAKII